MGAEILGVSVGYWVVGFIVVAAGAYASYTAGAKDVGSYEQNYEQGIRVNTRSTTEPVKVVYGVGRIGGNDVYYYNQGQNNEIIWVVQTLCEGPIDSILVGDDTYDEIYIGNDKAYTYPSANLSYWLKTGTKDQTVEANLNGVSSEWTDTMRYTAHMVWKLTYDQNIYQGLPKRQCVVKGRLLYDVRDGTTAWSDNIALAIWDWLTNGRYGMGYNAGKLDVDSFISAANYCDTKDWHINLVIFKQDKKIDVLNKMLALMRGKLQWYDGKLYLRYSDLNYESVAMTLEDEHILRDEKGKALISISQPSKLQKTVGLNVMFTDPDKEYTTDSVPIGEALGKVEDYELLGCSDREHAVNIGYYTLERQTLDRVIRLPVRDDCLKLEPHDIVALNTTSMYIQEEYMRVVESMIRQDGIIELALEYESELLYNDAYDTNVEDAYNVTLPDPTDQPPGVTNVTITEQVYSYRMRSETRFLISFDPPTDYIWFDHVEVWQSFDNVNWTFLFPVVDDFYVGPLEEGQLYYFRMKVVSSRGIKQDDEDDYKISKEATGQSTALPPSLTVLYYILSRNNGLTLFSQKIFDDDIEVYEFRLGTSWSGGVFLASLRSPNLVYNMVKPGTHTIFCNTLGTNGLYGASPVSVQVALPDPPDDYSVMTTKLFNNLVTNGDMELDANWASEGSPTTNERSSQQKHGENYSRKFTVDAQFEGIESDTWTSVNGRKYGVGLFIFPDDTTTAHIRVRKGDNSGWAYDQEITGLTQDEWNEVTFNYYEGGVSGGSGAYIQILSPSGQSSGSWFVDDVCILEGDFANNVNPILYSGDAYIKCSHAGSVLTGYWMSPIIDLGSLGTYLVYSLNDIVIAGQGTLWSNQMPSPTTWSDVGATTRKWREIFELIAAPSVEMSIDYGPDISVVNSASKLEILAAILTGRYYRLRIDIEDPQSEVFAYVEGPNLKFAQ